MRAYRRLRPPTCAEYLRAVPCKRPRSSSCSSTTTSPSLLLSSSSTTWSAVKKVLMSGVYMRGKPVNDKPLFPTLSSSPHRTPHAALRTRRIYTQRGGNVDRREGPNKGGGTGGSTPPCCKRGSVPGGGCRRARSSLGWRLRVITLNPTSSLSGSPRCCWAVAVSKLPNS